MKQLFLLFAILSLTSCLQRNKVDDPVIAKVFNEELYLSEIQEVVPDGIDPQDSLRIAKSHIDKWIRNQLLLNLAEENLSEEDKDVEQKIEDYRSSLLIFKYQQNFITQKLDTVIAEEDIQEYYDSFASNFLLNHSLIKGMYIRVPRSAKERYKVTRWYKSDDPEHLKELEEYCYDNGAEFDYFDESWRPFREVVEKMPKRYGGYENVLKTRKFYEIRDTSHYYYLKVSDYRSEGTEAPLEWVYDDLRSILLNKRKLEIIQKLESNVYNDALNRGNFSVYD